MGSRFGSLAFTALRGVVSKDADREHLHGPWVTKIKPRSSYQDPRTPPEGFAPEDCILTASDGHMMLVLRLPEVVTALLPPDVFDWVIGINSFRAIPIEAALAFLKKEHVGGEAPSAAIAEHLAVDGAEETRTSMAELVVLVQELKEFTAIDSHDEAVPFSLQSLMYVTPGGVLRVKGLHHRGNEVAFSSRSVTFSSSVLPVMGLSKPDRKKKKDLFGPTHDLMSVSVRYFCTLVEMLSAMAPDAQVVVGWIPEARRMFLTIPGVAHAVIMGRYASERSFALDPVVLVDDALLKHQWPAPNPKDRAPKAHVAGAPFCNFPANKKERWDVRFDLGQRSEDQFNPTAVTLYVEPECKPIMLVLRNEAAFACALNKDSQPAVHAHSAGGAWFRATAGDWLRSDMWVGYAVEHGDQAKAMRKWLYATMKRISESDTFGSEWVKRCLADLERMIRKLPIQEKRDAV
jgi:hypothetical protein